MVTAKDLASADHILRVMVMRSHLDENGDIITGAKTIDVCATLALPCLKQSSCRSLPD